MNRADPHTPWRILIREAEMASRGVLGGLVAPLRLALKEAKRAALPGGPADRDNVFARLQRASAYFVDAKPAARDGRSRELLRELAAEADQALAALTPRAADPAPSAEHPHNRLPYRDD